LEDLSSLDRHLMLFSATGNLSAVRWLLRLGAHWDACDVNSTTCLHVACRAGALAVVKELLQYKDLLKALDVAGWTSLHIAVLMGRREVVVLLLTAGAHPHVRNNKGQLPAELCADNGTFEAIRSYELHMQQHPGKPWSFNTDVGPGEDVVGSRLQYEPFFVPRQPVIRTQQYKKEFQRIGILMFNRQPGFGLAFLVAAGVARDYPVDMSTFLRRSKVDIKQVGNFLGEAFSLSHTIRLEFVNSVVLQNTGVVSALIQVFHMLQLPDDLQKINRLVHGVARIWWRQHERMLKDISNGAPALRPRTSVGQGPQPQLHLSEELVGLELKQYLTSSDALHQLMFSTVLLHWFMYRDGLGTKRELEYDLWKRLNAGIEQSGGDVPEHVQHQIYTLVKKAFIPELTVASGERPERPDQYNKGDAAAGGGAGDSAAIPEQFAEPLLTAFAAVEGWAQIVGGGFPRPQGLSGVQTVTYRHVSSIFSEVTHTNSSSMRFGSPLASGGFESSSRHSGSGAAASSAVAAHVLPGHHYLAPHGAATVGAVPAVSGPAKRDDHAWLSLCYTLLFFSASPGTGVPYAFIELRKICVAALDEEQRILTLAGAPDLEDDPGDGVPPAISMHGASQSDVGASCADASSARSTAPVSVVLLLPDGRWQELTLPKLELRLPGPVELQTWSMHLMPGSRPSRPSVPPVSTVFGQSQG